MTNFLIKKACNRILNASPLTPTGTKETVNKFDAWVISKLIISNSSDIFQITFIAMLLGGSQGVRFIISVQIMSKHPLSAYCQISVSELVQTFFYINVFVFKHKNVDIKQKTKLVNLVIQLLIRFKYQNIIGSLTQSYTSV